MPSSLMPSELHEDCVALLQIHLVSAHKALLASMFGNSSICRDLHEVSKKQLLAQLVTDGLLSFGTSLDPTKAAQRKAVKQLYDSSGFGSLIFSVFNPLQRGCRMLRLQSMKDTANSFHAQVPGLGCARLAT